MHAAGNYYGAWLDHHRISSGTDYGMTSSMGGRPAYNNNSNVMDSKYGRTYV